MKYYLDTEFLEGKQKERFPISLFRKETPNTIDLISIGIVSEDGHEYYAISKDFNLKEAWNRFQMKQVSGDARNRYPEGVKEYWIRENVLKPIFEELLYKDYPDTKITSDKFIYNNLKYLINKYGKTNKQIAEEIKEFCNPPYIDTIVQNKDKSQSVVSGKTDIEFYAYYADYDWVGFCWLFGKMIGLPKGFPMYCRDLKQILDEKPLEYKVHTATTVDGKYIAGIDPYYAKWQDHVDYPKQENEHSAIHDARWNKKLHEFLIKI